MQTERKTRKPEQKRTKTEEQKEKQSEQSNSSTRKEREGSSALERDPVQTNATPLMTSPRYSLPVQVQLEQDHACTDKCSHPLHEQKSTTDQYRCRVRMCSAKNSPSRPVPTRVYIYIYTNDAIFSRRLERTPQIRRLGQRNLHSGAKIELWNPKPDLARLLFLRLGPLSRQRRTVAVTVPTTHASTGIATTGRRSSRGGSGSTGSRSSGADIIIIPHGPRRRRRVLSSRTRTQLLHRR